MNKRGQSATAALPRAGEGIFHELFGPIGNFLGQLIRKTFKILLILVIVAIVFIVFYAGTKYFLFKQQTGELASTVTHAEIGAVETLSPVQRFLKSNAPALYYALNPEKYNPYAIDSQVEVTQATQDLGVKINEFKMIGNRNYFFSGEAIHLTGKITAGGFPDSSYDLEVFCDLDGAKTSHVPGTLLGPNARGNKGTVGKGVTTQFVVQCDYPDGIAITEPQLREVSKQAKLTVNYNFKTKSYDRIWFLNQASLLNLQARGIDPFKLYNINDPLLNSNGYVTPKQTPGPINLGLSIPFAQPLTTAEYQLVTSISSTATEGNLDSLQRLSIEVPSVNSVNMILKGEEGYNSANGVCDFDYVGDTGTGYKEYQLRADKIKETNTKCDKEGLILLGLSEADCLSIFKQPVFTCNFAVTRVPQTGLQSDKITATAQYTLNDIKRTAVTIRATPQQIQQQLTVQNTL